MTKSIDSTSAWHIFDDQRDGYNRSIYGGGNDELIANTSAVEAAGELIDILATGFVCRRATDPNVAETYVYAAWAKAPLVNSNGVPCNARV